MAQSKDVRSLLAAASTGTRPASPQGSNPGSDHDCGACSAGQFAEKNCAPVVGCAASPGHDSFADHYHAGDDIRIGKERHGCCRPSSSTTRRITMALTVVLSLSMVVLSYFCAHLYNEVRDLKERCPFENCYPGGDDPSERPPTEFVTMFTKDAPFSESNGLTKQSSDALLQLLRSNGFPENRFKDFLHTRTKRSAVNEAQVLEYIETIVINYLRGMPKVHLRGLNNANDGEYVDDEYLVWQPDSESQEYFVPRAVGFVKVHHQHNRFKAIRIHRTGVYVVYSQVIVNGTSTRGWRRDCAHQTVTLPHHDGHLSPRHHKVLLSGFVTQDSQGRYDNDSIPFPRDSSLQMGIFRLLRQTEVRVRVPAAGDCRRTIFTTDLHSSYFGLFQIG